jgi:hypothetical protein
LRVRVNERHLYAAYVMATDHALKGRGADAFAGETELPAEFIREQGGRPFLLMNKGVCCLFVERDGYWNFNSATLDSGLSETDWTFGCIGSGRVLCNHLS